MKLDVQFHGSQWPEAMTQQLQSSLRRGVVPGLYLYDSAAQSARWLAYHEGWSPARTNENVQSLYDRAFADAIDAIPAATYVSLGCGGGQKDARWVRLAGERCGPLVLTDSSPSLVLTASQAVTRAGAKDVRLVVLDLSAWPERDAYGVGQARDARPTVWACLGILPNFEHEHLLPYLARLMAPSDRLVLSANLSPEPYAQAAERIVPQYDNPLAHAWYDGALLELGFPAATTDRRLVHAPLDDAGQSWRMRYVAVPGEDVTLDVHGQAVHFAAGTEVQVFQSTRYTPERLEQLCATAGLTRCSIHVDDRREEGVLVLQRADASLHSAV